MIIASILDTQFSKTHKNHNISQQNNNSMTLKTCATCAQDFTTQDVSKYSYIHIYAHIHTIHIQIYTHTHT